MILEEIESSFLKWFVSIFFLFFSRQNKKIEKEDASKRSTFWPFHLEHSRQTHRFVHFSNGHGVQRAITTDVHARLRAHFSDDLVGNKSAGGCRKTHARQKERERKGKRKEEKRDFSLLCPNRVDSNGSLMTKTSKSASCF